MDAAPVLGHREMGMDMSSMDMSSMDHSSHDMSNMDDMKDMDMSAMDHNQPATLAKAGFGSNFDGAGKITHANSEFGAQVDGHVMAPQSGLADPGIGLREHQTLYGRKVLTYADLRSLHPTRDKREPTREIEFTSYWQYAPLYVVAQRH